MYKIHHGKINNHKYFWLKLKKPYGIMLENEGLLEKSDVNNQVCEGKYIRLKGEGEMIQYLDWIDSQTPGVWWHDSAIMEELEAALASGAKGVTVNPVLTAQSLSQKRGFWRDRLSDIPGEPGSAEYRDEIIRRLTLCLAERLAPAFEASGGSCGYVCSQVDPRRAGDRDYMLGAALRISSWAPNVAVKLPVTMAGLDVLEECAARGIPVVGTVSFTLPQILQVEARYRAGLRRARENGTAAAPCFAVVMVGRIDDYLRDVIRDTCAQVLESDIIQAGTVIMKRANQIWRERQCRSVLMPAGMRGAYHLQALAGAQMAFSVHPKIQRLLAQAETPYQENIDKPVPEDVVERLNAVPEFRRAADPDGMRPEEFMGYGAVQRTLAQFVEGWNAIENYRIE